MYLLTVEGYVEWSQERVLSLGSHGCRQAQLCQHVTEGALRLSDQLHNLFGLDEKGKIPPFRKYCRREGFIVEFAL